MADFGSARRASVGGTVAQQANIDLGLRSYMLRIYNYMAGGLAVTAAVALLVASSEALMASIFGSPLKWLVLLAPLGIILWVSFKQQTMSPTTLKALYGVFTVLFGISMSTIFYVYTNASIAQTFFVTAASFAGLSLYGYTTKKDLSGFGTFLVMGLMGLMLASIVNIFLGAGWLQFAITLAGVLIFAGLTAYDTQNLKNVYVDVAGTPDEERVSIMGAWSLYLDFINLFQFLLALIGQRDD
jgi:uncharacterized protein